MQRRKVHEMKRRRVHEIKVVSMLLLCTMLLFDFQSVQADVESDNASAISDLTNAFACRDVGKKCTAALVRVIKSGTGGKSLDCTVNVRRKLLQSLMRIGVASYENFAIAELQLRGDYA